MIVFCPRFKVPQISALEEGQPHLIPFRCYCATWWEGAMNKAAGLMPDGLVFYYGFLFSTQDTLLLAPLVGDSLAQTRCVERRRHVASDDAMHDLRR